MVRQVKGYPFEVVTDDDLNTMLYDPVTRPYIRDEKGEKVQSFDSAMWEIEFTKHKELANHRPEDVAKGISKVTLPVALV